MALMRGTRFLFVVSVVFAIACGPEEASVDFGHHDLSTADQARDFSTIDLAGRDAAVPDLAQPMCDLGVPSGVLVAAVQSSTNSLYVALLDGATWNDIQTSSTPAITDVALSSYAGVPLLVARQTDATLSAAFFGSCQPTFPTLTQLFTGASTSHRPAVSGGDVVFKGSTNGDQNIYHTSWTGSAWTPAVQQTQFTTTYAPTAVRPASTVHTIFTGTDSMKTIYDGTISDSPGGGTASAFTGATTAHEPAAVATGGKTLVVFTGMDTNLYATGGNFAAPTSLCTGIASCVMTSNLAPVLSLDSTAQPIVAFVGKDPANNANNYRVYSSSLTPSGSGGQWSAAVEASSGETTNFPLGLAPGVGGDLAELLWVRASDGALRHARLTGAGWQTPTTVKAATFGASPSVIVLP